MKSYFVYLFEFNLDIQNSMQQFLLFINPISSAFVFLGLALFDKGRRVAKYIIVVYTFMSVFLYANIVFYRFNSDFITLPVLTQTSNFGSLGSSVASLIEWTDVLFLFDITLLVLLYIANKKEWNMKRLNLKYPTLVIMAGIILFSVNLSLAEADRPQLLKRTFDRNYIVKYLGAYNFAVYDAIQNIKTSTERVLADSNDITVVKNYTYNKFANADEI